MAPKVKEGLVCGKDCFLHKGCLSPHMIMDGDLDGDVLFVGEAPGQEEDREGRPFIGKAGQLLREAIGLTSLKKYAFTNAVKCRPPENRTPTLKEIKTCQPTLLDEIAMMPNLKLVVPLGNVALQAIVGIKGGISKYSGKLLKVGKFNVMPVFHPAYILRNQDELKTFYDHIARIPNALDGTLVTLDDVGKYEIITDIAKWKVHRREIILSGTFAFDMETSGLKPWATGSIIRCIGLSYKEKEAIVVPTDKSSLARWSPEDWESILEDLKILFESKVIRKVGQNAKFDNLWLKRILGIETNNLYWDTKIAEYLLNENESNHLKDMAWKYTKMGGYEEILQGKPHELDNDELLIYCAMDTDITFRIFKQQEPLIYKDPRLSFILCNLLCPVSSVLLRMEDNGIRVDLDVVETCEKKVDGMLEDLVKQMRVEKSIIDWERDNETDFNPKSHVQLREILYKYEGLPIVKETEKTKAPSTDREALEQLSDRSNLCKLLSTYSLYSAMKTKSIAEIKEYLMPDNKIHTTYWLTETVTGRTSSKTPNLQNIPKGDKDIVGIRKAFVAEPGCLLVEMDYNQHELRVMAELAEDEVLKNALKGDVHIATVSALLHKPPSEVTSEERRTLGKTMNFGIIYGMTEFGIAKRLNCDKQTALAYKTQFFTTYYKTFMFMKEMERMAKEEGYVVSRSGRYRRLPAWRDTDEESIREGINMPVQTTAGDILLYSLMGIDQFLRENMLKSYLVMETHDSLTLNVYPDEMNIIQPIKHIMLTYFKNFMQFKTPLAVDIKVGKNLGEMEEI